MISIAGIVVLHSSPSLAARPEAIVTAVSQVVRSPFVATTNIWQFKLTANAARFDWSAEVSTITWPEKSESVELHHPDRTYVRKPTISLGAVHSLTNLTDGHWVKAVWQGKPAEMLSWTNGPQTGMLYTVSPSLLNLGVRPPESTGSGPTPGALVGTLLSSNRLLVRTDVTNQAMVPAAALGNAQAGGTTNISYVISSDLQSVVFTNVPASDFEIPKDYTEVAEFAPKPAFVLSGLEGPGPTSEQLLRRRMEQLKNGAPPLRVPQAEALPGRGVQIRP